MAREIDELEDDRITESESEREKLRGVAPEEDEEEFDEIESDEEDLDDDESTF